MTVASIELRGAVLGWIDGNIPREGDFVMVLNGKYVVRCVEWTVKPHARGQMGEIVAEPASVVVQVMEG